MNNWLRVLAKSAQSRERKGAVSIEQRRAWAEAIRAPMRAHPKQLAFATSTAKLKAACGNRRAGKTEGPGREETALLIEHDGLVTWVLSDTLKAFDRNWLSRGRRRDGKGGSEKVGMLSLLDSLGVPYHAPRSSDGAVSEVTFPWGSRLQVLPAGDNRRIQDIRGGLFDRLWLDEAQKMPLLTDILTEIAGPASMDFDAIIIMTGTPGEEEGSFFHSVTCGDVPGWEVHDITACDNPRFGATWAERWRTVMERGPRKHRGALGLTDEQLDRLALLTEDTFSVPQLSRQRWVRELPAKVQREYLRLWVADASSLVYPSAHLDDAVRHWADWAPYVTAAAFGQGQMAADLKRQTVGWAARFDALPKRLSANNQLVARDWRALVGLDLGSRPDPFTITVQMWGSDGVLYEFDTGKAYDLRDDEQQDVIAHWLTAARDLPNVTLWGVVVDAGGGNTPATVNGWRHRLAPLLPVTGIMAAYKPHRDMQIRLLNMERSAGRLRTLRNGPIHLEEDHLQLEPWDPDHPKRPREEAKHRVVKVQVRDDLGRPMSLEVMPGNDACDARRYPWYWATHIHERQEREREPAQPLTRTAAIEHQLDVVRRARGRR